ncbi:MAG TPA: DUF1326 domain-containing protein [Pirellulales bacterium]|nr:DUF1326 domain-containing protein [Pirellulales bacterium]
MLRRSLVVVLVVGCALVWLASGRSQAGTKSDTLRGNYLESRTCDIYTGPCFANSQVGLGGHEALLAWNVESGSFDGVDVSGLNVVMAVSANDTLGFDGGLEVTPEKIKSVILVDERADTAQREALIGLAKKRAPRVVGDVVRVAATAIKIDVDHAAGVAHLDAGKEARLTTRKIMKCDCVCTNESVFYPPLAQVEKSSPAYTVDGGFGGRGLNEHWSNPETRSAFVARFAE